MYINQLSSLPGDIANGNALAIETDDKTYKVDFNKLATTALGKTVKVLTSTTNIDDIKATSIAYCAGATGTDIPANGYGFLVCISSAGLGTGTRVVQYFTEAFNTTIWVRRYVDSWGDWAKLVNQNIVPISAGGTGANSAGGARQNIGVHWQVFRSVTDLGLTEGSATILSAFNAMPNNSMLLANSSDFTSGVTPGAGVVEIVRRLDSRTYVVFHSKNQSVGDYRMYEGASSYNGNDENAPNGTWYPDFPGLRGGTGELGTTLQINLPNNSSHLLALSGNGAQRRWVGIVQVSSTGTVSLAEISTGTDATASTATNKVTITCSSGTELAFTCLPIRGGRFTGYTIS